MVSSEDLIRTLLFDTGDSILLVDPHFRVMECNPRVSDMFHLPPHQIPGRDCDLFFEPAVRFDLLHTLQGLSDDENWIGELRGVRGGDQTFPMDVTIKRLPLPNGTIFCIILRDLSEYHALQELLRQEKAQRREMYITLRNLMQAFEREKQGLEGGISHQIETVLLPALEKIRFENNPEIRNSYLNILREQLIHLTRGFSRELDGRFLKLTRSEVRICQLIQEGHANKEIAEIMHISFETVQAHRRNIRKKLDLGGRKVNLYTLLSSRPLFHSYSAR